MYHKFNAIKVEFLLTPLYRLQETLTIAMDKCVLRYMLLYGRQL